MAKSKKPPADMMGDMPKGMGMKQMKVPKGTVMAGKARPMQGGMMGKKGTRGG